MKQKKRMRLASILFAGLLTATVACLPAAAAAPSDAVMYADFNTGPMAEPEGSMPATENGGTLTVNDGPIAANAEIVDGAMKLTLGVGGYYGIQSDTAVFRDASGKITDYKYLVIRMKGEIGDENTSPKGFMMSIGGGDGLHIGTFSAEPLGTAMPYKDPDGKNMPLITTEYRDFVIALSDDIIRPDQGRDLSGINFNTAASSVTIYIDEIYLTNTIPDGYVNEQAAAPTTAPTTEQSQTPAQDGDDTEAPNTNVTAPQGNQLGTTVATPVNTVGIVLIVVVAVVLLLNVALIVVVVLQLAKLKKGLPVAEEPNDAAKGEPKA